MKENEIDLNELKQKIESNQIVNLNLSSKSLIVEHEIKPNAEPQKFTWLPDDGSRNEILFSQVLSSGLWLVYTGPSLKFLNTMTGECVKSFENYSSPFVLENNYITVLNSDDKKIDFLNAQGEITKSEKLENSKFCFKEFLKLTEKRVALVYSEEIKKVERGYDSYYLSSTKNKLVHTYYAKIMSAQGETINNFCLGKFEYFEGLGLYCDARNFVLSDGRLVAFAFMRNGKGTSADYLFFNVYNADGNSTSFKFNFPNNVPFKEPNEVFALPDAGIAISTTRGEGNYLYFFDKEGKFISLAGTLGNAAYLVNKNVAGYYMDPIFNDSHKLQFFTDRNEKIKAYEIRYFFYDDELLIQTKESNKIEIHNIKNLNTLLAHSNSCFRTVMGNLMAALPNKDLIIYSNGNFYNGSPGLMVYHSITGEQQWLVAPSKKKDSYTCFSQALILSEQYLVTTGNKINVWNMQNKKCISTIEMQGHLIGISKTQFAIVSGTGVITVCTFKYTRPINSNDLLTLIGSLEKNNSITNLSFSGITLNNKTVIALIKMLEKNKNIKKLNLSDVNLSNENSRRILAFLKESKIKCDGINLDGNKDILPDTSKQVNASKNSSDFIEVQDNMVTELHLKKKLELMESSLKNKFDEFILSFQKQEEIKNKNLLETIKNQDKKIIELNKKIEQLKNLNPEILDSAIQEYKIELIEMLLNTPVDFNYCVLIFIAQKLEKYSKILTEKGAIFTFEQLKKKTEEILKSTQTLFSQKYLKRLYQGISDMLLYWQKNKLGDINEEFNRILDKNAIKCLLELQKQGELGESLVKILDAISEQLKLYEYQSWLNKKDITTERAEEFDKTIASAMYNRWKTMNEIKEFPLSVTLTYFSKILFLQHVKENKLKTEVLKGFIERVKEALIKQLQSKSINPKIGALIIKESRKIQDEEHANEIIFDLTPIYQKAIPRLFQQWQEGKLANEEKENFENVLLSLVENEKIPGELRGMLERAAADVLLMQFKNGKVDEQTKLEIENYAKVVILKLKTSPQQGESALKTVLEKWKKQELSSEDGEFLSKQFNKEWQEYLHKLNLLLNPYLQIEALQKQVTALQMQVEKLSSASNQDTKEEKQPSSTYSQAQLMSAHGILASNSKNESPASNENELLENKELENTKMENS